MTKFLFKTVFTANAAPGTTALDGSSTQVDLDTAFVKDSNRYYRWFASDTSPVDGEAVLQPAGAPAAAAGRWIRQGPPGPVKDPALYELPGDFGFDYTISSRQDLVNIVAPVSGAFDLPSGRYKFCANVTLDADEYLHVTNNNEVLLESNGGGINGVEADAAQVILVDSGTLQLVSITLDQLRGGSEVLNLDAGTVLAIGATLGGLVGGNASVDQSGGTLSMEMCYLEAVGGLDQSGGSCRLAQTFVSGGEGAVVNVTGASQFHADQCHIQQTASGPIVGAGDTSNVSLEDCFLEFLADTAAPGVNTSGSAKLTQEGGTVRGNVAGNSLGATLGSDADAVIKAVYYQQLAAAITDGGTQLNRCVIDSCSGDDSVAIGVDWAAANVPVNGLVETALAFNTATPFANHVETDARVNRKACTDSSGLVVETPIV